VGTDINARKGFQRDLQDEHRVRSSPRMRKAPVEWWKCGDNNKKIED
jgi:hypothetical protein